MPRISVIMASYNHEKYVAEAIRSVLDQTYDDFEIVITDDGSTDGTVEEIKKFRDPRIRLFTFKENRGACVAARKCLDEAKGEFIAILSSDDAFLPDKLEKQVKLLDERQDIRAVFGFARIIDEEGVEFADEKHFYYNIFRQDNRTRHEWLRYFFFNGNCLCHPSALIRRKLYDEIGYYDERFAQLPDFDFWIRTCLRHEIFVIPEELIRFRVRAGEANVSGQKPEARIRTRYEMSKVFANYLRLTSTEDLLKVFPEAEQYGRVVKDMIPYFIARTAIDNATIHPVHSLLGINVLFDLLGDRATAERLEKEYAFRYADFIRLTGEQDIFNIKVKQKLIEKESQLIEKENQLETIFSSSSWRVTAPLRRAAKIIKKEEG